MWTNPNLRDVDWTPVHAPSGRLIGCAHNGVLKKSPDVDLSAFGGVLEKLGFKEDNDGSAGDAGDAGATAEAPDQV